MAKNLTPAHLRCPWADCQSVHELQDGRLLLVGEAAVFHPDLDGHAVQVGGTERAIIIDRELLANLSPWQPISTAPKDGTVIILGWAGKAVENGFWDAEACEWMPDASMADEIDVRCRDFPEWMTLPTHWQPLPLPPELIDRELLSGLDSALRTGEESKSGAM